MRNEGLTVKKTESLAEIDLEIDEEGAANEASEGGSSYVKDDKEFAVLSKKLETARAKPEDAIGEGGFKIDFVNPKEFKNKINMVVLANPEEPS